MPDINIAEFDDRSGYIEESADELDAIALPNFYNVFTEVS